MAATQKGIWDVQEVRDKQLANSWPYTGAPAERTNLYMWGANSTGTLGLNEAGGWSAYLTAQSSPIQIPGNWANLSTASGASGGVKTNGTLWTWGDNGYGQLGLNAPNNDDRSSPTQVGSGTDWSAIFGSRQNFYAVKTNGSLWVAGRNENGKLGLNQDANHNAFQLSSPTQLPGTWSTDVIKFRSSNYHTIAIKANGTLWNWGSNQYGTLGMNSSGGAGTSGQRYSSPVQVGTETTWNSCIGGYYWSAATKTNGTLWTWGGGASGGQLGLNQGGGLARSSPCQVGTDTTWSKVVGGYHEVYGIKTDGTLWSWGNAGALNEASAKRSSPTQIPGTTWKHMTGSSSFMATKTDGTLWAWGDNQAGQNAQNDRGGYDGLYGPLLSRSSPTQIPGGWRIDNVNMSGGPGGRQFGALKS